MNERTDRGEAVQHSSTLDLNASQPAGASRPSQPRDAVISSVSPGLKAFTEELKLNSDKLMVGKAALPPLVGQHSVLNINLSLLD